MLDPFSLSGFSRAPILITGHTGFKGTWLTILLEKLGFEVIGISLPPAPNSLFQKMSRFGNIEEKFIDICNIDEVYKFAKATNPEIIIHLAAQSLVKVAFQNPVSTFKTNVIGTANILEIACKIPSVKAVGVVTTDKVYKNKNTGIRFRENDELGANEPYSASKVAAEATVMAWHSILESKPAYKLMSFRSGNVIGGGDLSEARLIPDLVRNLYFKQPLVLRNVDATRPWQHVLDPLVGYLRALNYAVTNETYLKAFNFGPNELSLKVGKVVEIFMDESGFKSSAASQIVKTEFYESSSLELDNSLAREILNWRPVWNQEEAIRKTANWWCNIYRNQLSETEAINEEISSYFSSKLLE